MNRDENETQRALIRALAAAWQRAGEVSLIETHISRVVLSGDDAWKFKKPVRFPFLDFTGLARRRHYCEEEFRLGQRLAPGLYLGVVPITGSPEDPVVDGGGAAIEYAVKMRRFPQEALWTSRIAQGSLTRHEADALAEHLARFHGEAEIAAADTPWGCSELVFSIADSTFQELDVLLQDAVSRATLEELRRWEATEQSRLAERFGQRKREGRVRACHGDLHCGNILTLDGRVQAFDGIEFNDAMRWTDVMNDLAFACMDLRFRGQDGLASRLLNQYLERTGDYGGLGVFPYYQVHRALVRCKVALLAAVQEAGQDRASAVATAARYLAFARECAQPAAGAILITHGFSGCGKSTFAAALAERGGLIRLRSDVERKRLYGRAVLDRPGEAGTDPLYAAEASRSTYERLHELARRIVTESGFGMIIDAAFLQAAQRRMFSALAAELGVPFLIVDVVASEGTLRSRLARRAQQNQDASDADGRVLSRQRETAEPLGSEEEGSVIRIDMEEDADPERLSALSGEIVRHLEARAPR